MTEVLVMQSLITGVLLGTFYALFGLGLSIVWGITGFVNVAHGAFAVLAAYVAYFMVSIFQMDLVISSPLVVLFFLAFGYFLFKTLVRALIGKPMINTLIFFFGLFSLIYAISLVWFGTTFRMLITPLTFAGVNIHGIVLSLPRFTVGVLSAILYALSAWFFNKTKIGKAIRATAQSKDAAELMGIDTISMYTVAFGYGLAMAAFSGICIGILESFNPEAMMTLLPVAFAVCVLGGYGSIRGSLVAGLIIGILESIVSVFWPLYRAAVVSMAIIFTLLVRPRGIFGEV